MRVRTAAAICGSLALSACATMTATDSSYFPSRPGASSVEFERTTEVCRKRARSESRNSAASVYAPNLASALAATFTKGVLEGNRREESRVSCMHEFGYVATRFKPDQIARMNRLSSREDQRLYLLEIIDDAGRNPDSYERLEEAPERVRAIPVERGRTIRGNLLNEQNGAMWIYSGAGVRSSHVLYYDGQCQISAQASGSYAAAAVMSDCMSRKGLSRTALSEAQKQQITSMHSEDERREFLLSVIDDAGQNPEKYTYLEE